MHATQVSVTHQKKRILLLNLRINCISAKSPPKNLSIKGDCAFLKFSTNWFM